MSENRQSDVLGSSWSKVLKTIAEKLSCWKNSIQRKQRLHNTNIWESIIVHILKNFTVTMTIEFHSSVLVFNWVDIRVRPEQTFSNWFDIEPYNRPVYGLLPAPPSNWWLLVCWCWLGIAAHYAQHSPIVTLEHNREAAVPCNTELIGSQGSF